MSEMVARLDDWGQPAWIAVMVLCFVLFWPVGLAVLAYMIWSGRMGCRGYRKERWQQRMTDTWEKGMDGWSRRAGAYTTSGNTAFDEYRDATLKRLEEEQREFRSFLERLRAAKDRSEFDQFMSERKGRGAADEAGTSGSASA